MHTKPPMNSTREGFQSDIGEGFTVFGILMLVFGAALVSHIIYRQSESCSCPAILMIILWFPVWFPIYVLFSLGSTLVSQCANIIISCRSNVVESHVVVTRPEEWISVTVLCPRPPPSNAECNNAECVICLEHMQNASTIGLPAAHKVQMLSCGHTFHTHCIKSWVNTGRFVCPLCRKSLP
jgi:RING-H2 zinc finger domain